jgi:protein O-GlcNAc transferase
MSILPNYYDIFIKNARYRDDPIIFKEEISRIFMELMAQIRILYANENIPGDFDPISSPMGLLFPCLKPLIIRYLILVSPPTSRYILSNLDFSNFNMYRTVFDRLVDLGAKDTLLWMCFHIPYYDSNNFTRVNKLVTLSNWYAILDYACQKWPSNLYFTENEFLFSSNNSCMPYAASYHWDNNRHLLEKYCRLIRIICPWINYHNPKIDNYNSSTPSNLNMLDNNNGKKIKIVFISDNLVCDSSVLRDRAGIIGKLDSNMYEVYVASFVKKEKIKHPVAKKFIDKLGNKFLYLGNSLSQARDMLAELKVDIIIYPDIGMKVKTTLLAYSRIAPIQMNTWGHSETSGINTIDYFISSRYFEHEELSIASNFYSEKLIIMNSLSTYYIPPSMLFLQGVTNDFLTRDKYGFSSDIHLYGCLQTFYKINEEMEDMIISILQMDPKGVVLLSNSFPYPYSLARRMVDRLGEANKHRIKWYPPCEKKPYLNLVSICDVHLDPFPFGGCNTTYDAFDFNIPVVSMPSKKISGRFTYGLYQKMGNYLVDDCIVWNKEDYVAKAVEIASNDKLRHKINRKIEVSKNNIYMDRESVEEWNNILVNLSNKKTL